MVIWDIVREPVWIETRELDRTAVIKRVKLLSVSLPVERDQTAVF